MTDVVNASTTDPVESIRDLMGGVDYLVDAIGISKTAWQAFEVVRDSR